MKVLSLFDGISCGMVALERAGIPVEAYAVALEELEEASVDFENTKTAFSYFWEDITANDDPTNDLIDAKHYAVEAIKELAQFAAVIDKTFETLEKEKEAGTEKISVVQKGDKK